MNCRSYKLFQTVHLKKSFYVEHQGWESGTEAVGTEAASCYDSHLMKMISLRSSDFLTLCFNMQFAKGLYNSIIETPKLL
jgi:hypothetical protein